MIKVGDTLVLKKDQSPRGNKFPMEVKTITHCASREANMKDGYSICITECPGYVNNECLGLDKNTYIAEPVRDWDD